MIDFVDVTRRLADKGVVFTVGTGGLKVEAPRGVLTPTIRDFITRHKSDFTRELSGMRGRLLTVSRNLGLPDALVLELPASELEAAAEQVTWMGDAETGHKLLVFYLRGLAGQEAASPGSVAERDAAARQAHVQTLRNQEHKP